MAGEIKSNRCEFFAQALMHRPIIDGSKAQDLARGIGRAEQALLTHVAVPHVARGIGEDCIRGLNQLAAIAAQSLEGTRFHEAFEGTLVDEAWIDTPGKIGDREERPARFAYGDDVVHGLPPDILHGGKRVIDDARLAPLSLVGVAGEISLALVDVGSLDLDREPRRLLAENI